MMTEINQFNLNAGLLNKYENLLHYNSFWHQIVVENVKGLDRDAVLRPLMRCCHPFHFIPVRYSHTGNQAVFLLKNCGSAIEKLCSHGLVIANPQDKDKPFKITIKLCYASSSGLKINIQGNLMIVLNKRFNHKTGILNLENFAKDPELEEYCALSQSKIFFYVLHLAKNIQFKNLKLINNDISSLKSMEALEGFRTPICVDLRNNNITDVSEIENMKHLNVVELLLDGNPICNQFDAINYGKAMKECLTKLEKLDGINIQLKGFLPFRRNFLCNYSGFDLVDQFLEHYFTLYDAQNRSVLEEVYHKDALFSLTNMYIPLQSTSATAKLGAYKQVSRNLKNLSDFSKNAQNLYAGRTQIVKLLCMLPSTEHDPYSFTADLIMYTETTAVLIVTGVFRECSDSLLESDRMLAFSRTFVLLAGQHGDYSIINEMLSVTNATSNRAANAFKYPRMPKLIALPPPQNSKERCELTDTLTVITGLKTEWSQRCLEECKYDFKDALSLFIELYKKDKVPKSAFQSEQEKIEFKNRRKITEPSTPVTPSGPSPLDKQRPALQPPPAPVGLKLAMPSAKSGQLHTQFSSGPLSPDHIWDKYSSQEKGNRSVGEPMDVIDLVNSPEQESHYEYELSGKTNKDEAESKTTTSALSRKTFKGLLEKQFQSVYRIFMENQNGQDHIQGPPPAPSTCQQEASSGELLPTPPLPENKQQKKKKVRQLWLEMLAAQAADIQRIYNEEGFEKGLEAGLNVISKHAVEYEVFETVMGCIYQINLEHARMFNDRVYGLSSRMSPFLNQNLIELLIARCEYKYGEEEVGEKKFKAMMNKRQSWARPVTEFCRVMLDKEQVDKARAVLQPYVYKKNPLTRKLTTIAKLLTQEYDVYLI